MILPAFLFLLALAVRVTWILLVPSKPVGDFAMYLESATHLLEHGAFDDKFIYMPGYVIAVAAVQWMGGGWLAVKLCGAAIAACGAPLVFGITHRLWGSESDRRSAAVAGIMYALWPGGVAVSSVTGTDIPAAVLVAAGAYALVRATQRTPYPAAIGAGLLFGIAAWIRAVALPLVPLGGVFLWIRTRSFKRASCATALATLAAVLVLSPWAIRNRLRYGEWFLSDSHGGLTALVGAYPNSDGQFTRALNRTYETVTGRAWLAEPHREADQAAYVQAKRWTRFEPAFAVGLTMARVDKLLSNERSLLYWPLYRAGVLKDPQATFFATWRPEIEFATDMVWWLLFWGCLTAAPFALLTRQYTALGLLPLQAALTAVYVLYFAESRYHLAIAALAFPGMAAIFVATLDAATGYLSRVRKLVFANDWAMQARSLAISGAIVTVVAFAWPAFVRASQGLKDRHRWAVNACGIDGSSAYCLWKQANAVRVSVSPIKGVFDGVGLASEDGEAVSAQTTLALAEHEYVLTGSLHLRWHGPIPPVAPPGTAIVRINGAVVAKHPFDKLFRQSEGLQLREHFRANGKSDVVTLEFAPDAGPSTSSMRLWLLQMQVNKWNP